jgi:flagellar biosynthesis protein FlhG
MSVSDPSTASGWPPLPSRPRTIAFTSGKGGVGKSSLVLNTGLALARRSQRVAILDGDLGLASLNVLLGLAPRFDLRHVMSGERRLAQVLLRGPHGICIIPAGSGVAELANLDDAARRRILAQLEEVAQSVDYLLIDTGAGISETVLSLVLAADEAVVVTRPEPTAMADAYALMKVIIRRETNYPFHLLINMVRDADEAARIHQGLSEILLRFLAYRPGYAGHVPTDPEVARSVTEQVPFVVKAPRCPAALAVSAVAAEMLGARAAGRDGAAGTTFWERVVRWGGQPV